MLRPSYDTFFRTFEAGHNQIVYTSLAVDLETPVSLFLKLSSTSQFSFLLESVTGGEVRGRYSIIGMDPDLIWQCQDNRSLINRSAPSRTGVFERQLGCPLENLRNLLAESRIDLPVHLPQSAAGLFGYLGYDIARHVEHLPNINPDPLNLPDAFLIRPALIIVLDGIKSEVTIVAPAWKQREQDARTVFDASRQRVLAALKCLKRQLHPVATATMASTNLPQPVSNFSASEYQAAVQKAREYIAAGDIFQVVPSQRWRQPFHLPPLALYRALRRTNPSPFLFFFDFGEFQIVGASPEILVRVFDDEVTIRPIAGTRPRGANPEADRVLEAELLADEKELAEHLMLLDLGRNDVGRVTKIGTVRPTEQFVIERYSHVMHIVSNVVGTLDDGKDALDAFLAGMPAGTVSGAPKVRAMEIIDELETEKRGVYGGGVGYFSAGGDMDMCIALRTAVIKDNVLYVQAGGGIVHDSDPETEYQETIHKSKALFSAAAEAAKSANATKSDGDDDPN